MFFYRWVFEVYFFSTISVNQNSTGKRWREMGEKGGALFCGRRIGWLHKNRRVGGMGRGLRRVEQGWVNAMVAGGRGFCVLVGVCA